MTGLDKVKDVLLTAAFAGRRTLTTDGGRVIAVSARMAKTRRKLSLPHSRMPNSFSSTRNISRSDIGADL